MDLSTDRVVISDDGGLFTMDLGGWTARAGFPNTAISGNVLVANGAGTATVRCRVQLTAPWTSNSRLLRIILLKNNIEVNSADFTVNTSSLTLGDISLALVSGDRIGVRVATTDERGVTVQSGANTYLYYDA
ncbi:hypothetical protein [Nocardia sp. NPDC050175]|uniref:hypothetical protein n=1 Tax=Nocardia sp. NPDC050175 TaxID=3364317 RepID=UPI00378D6DD4